MTSSGRSIGFGRATPRVQHPWYFRRYPYERALPGHLWLLGHDTLSPEQASPPGERRAVSLQISVEESYSLSGVHRPSATMRLETRWLIGLEAGWTHFIEPLPGGVDHFGIGNASLLIHARWNRVTLWSGLGLRILADPQRPDGGSGAAIGWNGSAGLRVYPHRPLFFDARLDYGSLGQAGVLHARAELGGTWRILAPYAGYDYLALGGIIFHGPLIGLRFFAY